MSLTPTLSATLGNLRYDSHAVEMQACLACLPRGGSVDLTLPAGVRFEAETGDDAVVEVDAGDGATKLFTGKVCAVRHRFLNIHVTLADAAAELSAFRPCQTFERQNASQVIKSLIAGSGAQVGDVSVDLDLPSYVAHPTRTAAEHVAELARLGGALAFIDADGKVQIPARPSGGKPSTALLYGREILSYSADQCKLTNPQRFAIGFGPAGSGSAPTALRHSLGFLPASAAAGGADVVRYPTPMLRTPTSAASASQALQTAAAARSQRLRARCILLPALRPGDVVEVQSLPGSLSPGPWLLKRVEHHLRPGQGGHTTLDAELANASSLLSDLVGAALSALGGFLP